MKETDDISKVIQRLHAPASVELDARVGRSISEAARSEPVITPSAEPAFLQLLKTLMRKKSTRYGLGAALGAALLAGLIFHQSTTSAWAIEDAIKALQKYKAIRMTGYTTAGGVPAPVEIWARANATGTRSDECLAKSENWTAWVEDNKTYVYDHASNKVLVDSAITIGMDPWLGPKLLAKLAIMPDYKAIEGDDPATGKRQILVTGGIESALGPQSFEIEFDAGTRLPVSMKHWLNLKRQGAPDFAFDKIVYFEDLPDSTFSFQPPPEVQFEKKPLTIPEANLPLLSDPTSGISVDGLSREEACRKLLGQFWTAIINDDLATIRRLCPLTRTWPDKLLLDVMAEDKAAELLRIGDIEQEGQSRLGPLALVPSRVRCKDGKVREMKIIVQFRETEEGTSCVVHGPYGHAVVVK